MARSVSGGALHRQGHRSAGTDSIRLPLSEAAVKGYMPGIPP